VGGGTPQPHSAPEPLSAPAGRIQTGRTRLSPTLSSDVERECQCTGPEGRWLPRGPRREWADCSAQLITRQ
jgi:hypothetical protein